MLAGLIFATEDATDTRDVLAATLPFGGATLIEFQARLLIAGGAGQVLIAVARVTPELLGAAARIGKRGVAVDIVRSAVEAAAKVHPLAQVVVIADGLVTDEVGLAPFLTAASDERLLVSARDLGLERVDAQYFWGGIARLASARLAEAARLPRDYDFVSTLLRVVAQHGASPVLLPDGAGEHCVLRDGGALARRGRAAFASLVRARQPWAARWLLGPVARLTLPTLVGRAVPPGALLSAGGLLGVAGAAAAWRGWGTAGVAATILATLMLLAGEMLASLRGDERTVRVADGATGVVAAIAVLAAGLAADGLTMTASATILAVSTIVAAALVERLRGPVRPRRWWASAAAYPLLLLPFVILGRAEIGLGALAVYAGLTLLGAIEDAREGLAGL